MVIWIDHICGDFYRSYVWCRDCHSPWRRDVRAATSFDRFGGKLIRFFIFSNWSDSLFLTTQWQRACSALITRWFILVSFFLLLRWFMVGVSVVSESEQPLWLAQVITECGFHVGLSIPVTTRATRNSCLIMIKIIVTMIMKLFDFQLATPTQICWDCPC